MQKENSANPTKDLNNYTTKCNGLAKKYGALPRERTA